MVRNGIYAEYYGREYPVKLLPDGTCQLFSYDEADLYRGFRRKEDILFFGTDKRPVVCQNVLPAKRLDDIFTVRSYVLYRGLPFAIEIDDDLNGEMFIVADGAANYDFNALGMIELDDGYRYGRWVAYSQVKIMEERKPSPQLAKTVHLLPFFAPQKHWFQKKKRSRKRKKILKV